MVDDEVSFSEDRASPKREQETKEGSTELGGESVVQDWVDGAVQVDHEAIEQKVGSARDRSNGGGVVDDEGAIWKPEHGEEDEDNGQHFYHLLSNADSVR